MSSFANRFGNMTVQQAIELNKNTKYENELITKLYTIWKNKDVPAVYRQWVQQAARYINRNAAKEQALNTLKDKYGFKFKGAHWVSKVIYFESNASMVEDEEYSNLMDVVFGGEK